MAFLSLDDIAVSGKNVLMRVDFNVPLNSDGKVADDLRIKSALPSIKKVLNEGGKLTLMSHLGRPKGEIVPELSLRPVADELSHLLNAPVAFAHDCISPEAEKMSRLLADGDVLLLENLRFYSGETTDDQDFARMLALHGEVYVNDAFGTAHRAHASTVGVGKYIDICAAGYLLINEINYLLGVLSDPPRPFIVILGGAKVADKIGVIRNLSTRASAFIIGGGMAFTFLKAKGKSIGLSLFDDVVLPEAKAILDEFSAKNVAIHLPDDFVVTSSIENVNEVEIIPDSIPDDKMGVDVGPRTIEKFTSALTDAKTVAWNGPMGIFEVPAWAGGTRAIAEKLAEITSAGTTTIVGGGDTAAAIRREGLSSAMSHVSTGGGASLTLMSGGKLPALDIITKS